MHTGPQNPSEVGWKDVKFIDVKKKRSPSFQIFVRASYLKLKKS